MLEKLNNANKAVIEVKRHQYETAVQNKNPKEMKSITDFMLGFTMGLRASKKLTKAEAYNFICYVKGEEK